MTRHAAIDLGATSGRVVVAEVTQDSFALREVHRFPNGPIRHDDGLHWDVTQLHKESLLGLRKAGPLDSVGIDSWAIDYGLLDAEGNLLNEPWCYRDGRTNGVDLPLSRSELFARNGLQHLPFTTGYQLAVDASLAAAKTVLLIPDLLTYWLTGDVGAEITNASTTGLLDARTRDWSPELLAASGLRAAQLGPLVSPGHPRGRIHDLDVEVITVGSHDTASAVVGTPLASSSSAYVSLGTWGLVGLELDEPVLTEEAQLANFTNELGVDGRTRFLRNVVGLWILEQCLQDWGMDQRQLPDLLDEAALVPSTEPFDLGSDTLLAPGDMPARVARHIDLCGLRPARRRAHLVRYILDSLAHALAGTLAEAETIAGVRVDRVNLVGGGAKNALLCQLLASRTGKVVEAGPVEATAIGNLLVQARAVGPLTGSLENLRDLVRRTAHTTKYYP